MSKSSAFSVLLVTATLLVLLFVPRPAPANSPAPPPETGCEGKAYGDECADGRWCFRAPSNACSASVQPCLHCTTEQPEEPWLACSEKQAGDPCEGTDGEPGFCAQLPRENCHDTTQPCLWCKHHSDLERCDGKVVGDLCSEYGYRSFRCIGIAPGACPEGSAHCLQCASAQGWLACEDRQAGDTCSLDVDVDGGFDGVCRKLPSISCPDGLEPCLQCRPTYASPSGCSIGAERCASLIGVLGIAALLLFVRRQRRT